MHEHKGARPHTCTWENCDKSFTEASNLRQHIRAVHEGSKPFKVTNHPFPLLSPALSLSLSVVAPKLTPLN
jgi:uncharacterized Zn-finger protein